GSGQGPPARRLATRVAGPAGLPPRNPGGGGAGRGAAPHDPPLWTRPSPTQRAYQDPSVSVPRALVFPSPIVRPPLRPLPVTRPPTTVALTRPAWTSVRSHSMPGRSRPSLSSMPTAYAAPRV